ncbi:MAG: hypothetical protein UV20_C0035G0006 [Candidatus Magasanikbacteria bacterium GW2011_GWA2_42_32]|uniref:Uncharacterized protein n=1 Tax=Candidatus Magasanikbacteria bacterium GW2011_GWA2_42_32 TaxID=1619039 RepID=A0A0G1CXF6_9BACT|nr:MAG: hypothetical protein UV20_C0035G0006 [Candidatus Magasanikbacteria bacterium GW2011_GWA2_42_32]
MGQCSDGSGGQGQGSESGSVFVIGAGGGVPAHGVLDISSGIVVVLLEVKAEDFVGCRYGVEVGPRDSQLHGVAASDVGCVMKDAGAVLRSS